MIELAKAEGLDGHTYTARSLTWTVDLMDEYWKFIQQAHIISDHGPKNAVDFLQHTLTTPTIWLDLYDETEEKVVGLIYIDEMVGEPKDMVQANWHALVFDRKVTPRKPIFQAAIRAIFERFGFHRLQVIIPMHFGGTIRAARRIGFKDEGSAKIGDQYVSGIARLRQNTRYNGVWYDSILMSILRSEVL